MEYIEPIFQIIIFILFLTRKDTIIENLAIKKNTYYIAYILKLKKKNSQQKTI